ncbi:hypothetical protein ACTMU2_30210 [Cupriavidus basilensis]
MAGQRNPSVACNDTTAEEYRVRESHFPLQLDANRHGSIQRVGDRWECFYGGEVPVEEGGALGELTVRTAEITDEQFIARMTQTARVKILEEGTPLMVALSDRSIPKKTPWPDVAPGDVPQGTTRFERIVIGPPEAKPARTKAARLFIGPPEPGGLWLRLKGLERSELMCSTVVMPDGFHEETAPEPEPCLHAAFKDV